MGKILFTPGNWYSCKLDDGREVYIVRNMTGKSWDILYQGESIMSVSDRPEMEQRLATQLTDLQVNEGEPPVVDIIEVTLPDPEPVEVCVAQIPVEPKEG